MFDGTLRGVIRRLFVYTASGAPGSNVQNHGLLARSTKTMNNGIVPAGQAEATRAQRDGAVIRSNVDASLCILFRICIAESFE